MLEWWKNVLYDSQDLAWNFILESKEECSSDEFPCFMFKVETYALHVLAPSTFVQLLPNIKFLST